MQGKPPATCTSLRKRSSSQGPCFQVVLGQWLLLKRIWKIRRKEKPTRKSGVLKMDKQARYEHLNNSHRKWSYFITAHCRARGLALCALVSSSVKQWFGWGEDLNYTLQGFLTFFFFPCNLSVDSVFDWFFQKQILNTSYLFWRCRKYPQKYGKGKVVNKMDNWSFPLQAVLGQGVQNHFSAPSRLKREGTGVILHLLQGS